MDHLLDDLEAAYSRSSSMGDTAGKRSDRHYIIRSNGTRVVCKDGRELIDMQMFNSSANFGYGNPAHRDALVEQLDRAPGIGSEYLTPERVQLADAIAKSVEDRLGVQGRVHFSVSGAQAVEDALKITSAITGRRSVFAFEGGYHGRTLAAAAVSSSYRYRHRFGSEGRAQFIPFPYCDRCAYGKTYPECALYCLDQFQRLLETEFAGVFDPASGEMEYTAFIAEPVLGRGGYVPPPPEYFPRLRQILSDRNLLLIVDDIQMAFYRSGKLWTMEHYGVEPDIILFGKAVTNGLFPVSGVWARNPILSPETWTPSSTHSTFGGHPLGMATGLATFREIETNDFEQKADILGRRLETALTAIVGQHSQLGPLRRLGLALSIEVNDGPTGKPSHHLATRIKERCLNADLFPPGEKKPLGIILTIGGFYDNILTIAPSISMDEYELERFTALFEAYVDDALSS